MKMMNGLIVRGEHPEDRTSIRFVHEKAFARRDEADLVDGLRNQGGVLASFIAEIERRIVGHVLYSRMSIETADMPVPAVALAPVAVLPEMQGQGVGTQMIRHGLECLRGAGEQIVIVLGNSKYYARFGFSTSKARSLTSPFPSESLMALEFKPGILDDLHGEVRYPDAFGLL